LPPPSERRSPLCIHCGHPEAGSGSPPYPKAGFPCQVFACAVGPMFTTSLRAGKFLPCVKGHCFRFLKGVRRTRCGPPPFSRLVRALLAARHRLSDWFYVHGPSSFPKLRVLWEASPTFLHLVLATFFIFPVSPGQLLKSEIQTSPASSPELALSPPPDVASGIVVRVGRSSSKAHSTRRVAPRSFTSSPYFDPVPLF